MTIQPQQTRCARTLRRFGLGGIGMKVPDTFGYYGCHPCHVHESDMDGHYWTKHARYIDLCDDCGDDMEIER